MKKTLLKTLLLTCLLSVWGANCYASVVLDFTNAYEEWGIPTGTGSTSNPHDETEYSNGTYTISIAAPTTSGNGFYYNSSGYLMLCQSGAYVKLPEFDFAVGTIVVEGNSGASSSTVMNIYVDDTAVSTACTGSAEDHTYVIDSNYQTVGTRYLFEVTSNHNAQVKSITIYAVDEEVGSDQPTGHGYEPDDPYTCEEAIEVISALASGGTISGIYVKGIVSTINSNSYSSSYGDLTYYISDDGTTSNQLEIYYGYYLNNEKFTENYAEELMVGDEVIVYGEFTNYNGNTPEGARAATYIYSLTRDGESIEPDPDPTGNGEVSTDGATLILTNPGVTQGQVTATIDFTSLGLENSTSVDGTTFTLSDGSSVVFAKGDGNNAPTYYTSGTAIRVYADNTITFTCNRKIAKIEIHADSSSHDGNTGTEYVNFSDDGTSAVYCNYYTQNSGGTYLYAQSITIYYEGEGGDEEPEPDTGDEHTFNFAENTYGMTVYSGSDGDYETEVTQITSDGVVLNFDSGHYRMWNSSGEGNHLRIGGSTSSNYDAYCTISGPTGSKVLEVVITSTGSSDNMSASNPTVDPEGGSYASHVYTWTGEAESVTFHFTSVTHVYYIDVTTDAEVTTGTITISSAGYATYYIEDAYVMPEGVTGTTVTGVEDVQDDGGYLLDMAWGYEAGSTVPAGTALVLKGEEGTYTYTITNTEATAPTDNLLMGSTSAVTTYGPEEGTTYLYYELTNGSNGIGFYWGADDGEAFTSGANKAWLPLEDTSAVRNVRFLGFGDGDDTTGISSVSASDGATVKGIYTIQGVRVSNMNQPGLYIVDGRKVIKR